MILCCACVVTFPPAFYTVTSYSCKISTILSYRCKCVKWFLIGSIFWCFYLYNKTLLPAKWPAEKLRLGLLLRCADVSDVCDVGAVPGRREEARHRRVQVQPDSLLTELRAAASGVPGVQEHCSQRSWPVHQERDVRRSRTWNAHNWYDHQLTMHCINMKLFRTTNIDVIEECRLFFDFLLHSEMLEIWRAKFNCKLVNCSNVLNYFGLNV